MILDIIFIRHGISRANFLQEKLYGIHFFYRDPELTDLGIEKSRQLQQPLKNKIKTYFGNHPHSICASCLIRTQETAYYMLAESLQNPIHVLPYICEFGYTLDNIPQTKINQYKFLETRNPKIVSKLRSGLCSEESYEHRSNWEKFMKWAEQNRDFFEIGKDGIYRAVIFSHSHFLQEIFSIKKLGNNEGLHTRINTENKLSFLYPIYEKIVLKIDTE